MCTPDTLLPGATFEPKRLLAPRQALPLHSAHTSLLAQASGYVVLTEDRWPVPSGEPFAVVRFSGADR